MTTQNTAAATTIETSNAQINNQEAQMNTVTMTDVQKMIAEALAAQEARHQEQLRAAYQQGVVEAKIKEPVRVETSATTKTIDFLFGKVIKPVANTVAKGEVLVRNQGHEKVLELSAKGTEKVHEFGTWLNKHGQGYAKKAEALKADRVRSEQAFKAIEDQKAAAKKAFEDAMAALNASAAAVARG